MDTTKKLITVNLDEYRQLQEDSRKLALAVKTLAELQFPVDLLKVIEDADKEVDHPPLP